MSARTSGVRTAHEIVGHVEALRDDPWDTSRDVFEPVYLVIFWHQSPAALDTAEMIWIPDEWRLTGARDIREAIEWAEVRCGPYQQFALYLEHEVAGQRAGQLLAGHDPYRGT